MNWLHRSGRTCNATDDWCSVRATIAMWSSRSAASGSSWSWPSMKKRDNRHELSGQLPGCRYDGGMLFVFPEPRMLSFWMYECLIDIDVIFLDASGTVTAIHRMPVSRLAELMNPSGNMKTACRDTPADCLRSLPSSYRLVRSTACMFGWISGSISRSNGSRRWRSKPISKC
jgi:hypothetical protein